MSQPDPLKIFCSVLPAGMYDDLRKVAGYRVSLVDVHAIDSAVQGAVIDRLDFAQQMLESAKRLATSPAPSPFDVDLRNAVSRAYYCVHHSIRAAIAFASNYTPYGHDESIGAFVNLCSTDRLLAAKVGMDVTVLSRFLRRIIERRHDADYALYGTQIAGQDALDFSVAATECCKDAERLLSNIRDYISARKALS